MLRHLLAAAPLVLQAQADPLKTADAYRHPWPSYQMEVEVSSRGQAQRWKVITAATGDARVEGLSKKERGRTVLLLGPEMWLLLPNAKRPVRVTPQQRLLGAAAGGDLARSSFSEDFQVTDRQPAQVDGQPALRLDLAARRPAATHRSGVLWVGEKAGEPLRAEFRLASGKLARTVTFGPVQEARGRKVISGMSIHEPNGTASELRFEGWAPAQPDPALFKLP